MVSCRHWDWLCFDQNGECSQESHECSLLQSLELYLPLCWVPNLGDDSILPKKGGLKGKVVLSPCSAAVLGMWTFVQMSHSFVSVPAHHVREEWFISCLWRLDFINYMGEKLDVLSTFCWLLAPPLPGRIVFLSIVESCWCRFSERISFLRLSEMTLHCFCVMKLQCAIFVIFKQVKLSSESSPTVVGKAKKASHFLLVLLTTVFSL